MGSWGGALTLGNCGRNFLVLPLAALFTPAQQAAATFLYRYQGNTPWKWNLGVSSPEVAEPQHRLSLHTFENSRLE